MHAGPSRNRDRYAYVFCWLFLAAVVATIIIIH
jgi:hypothetical protein